MASKAYIALDKLPASCNKCRFYHPLGLDSQTCEFKPPRVRMRLVSLERQKWCPMKTLEEILQEVEKES